MSSVVAELNSRLAQAIQQGLGMEVLDQESLVVPATNPKFGDYQCNLALPLGKQRGESPREVANQILNYLDVTDLCETPAIAGPGFINLTLKVSYLQKQTQQLHSDARLGVPLADPPLRVIVDFSSPNIAKEMHVGHLRSTIIGDCLARILEFRGHQVQRLNHVGDWGTQFGMLIAYLKQAYPEALVKQNALLIGDLVTLYKQAKQLFDQDEDFKETARQAVVKLQSADPESRKAWELLCEQSRREFQLIYDRLDISLEERGESFYNPFLAKIVQILIEQGLLEESDGAQCVFLDGFTNKDGDPLPLIVQKSDGGYNYATTDLAALHYRVNQDCAQRIIYVTDAGQANHFTQVFQVATKAGILPEEVEVVHVPFGLVLGEDGKKIKTRSGETIRLRDLLDEAVSRAKLDLEQRLAEEGKTLPPEEIQTIAEVVGISAVKYADLSQNRTSNYTFSYDKMLNLQGNTAPYLLYAYVRVQGISRKGQIDFEQLGGSALVLEVVPELVLAKHLLQFPDIIAAVEQDLLPNRLCQYLFELSQKFNQFYDQCPILSVAEPSRTSRLVLADLTARTLELGLSLLGISVLQKL